MKWLPAVNVFIPMVTHCTLPPKGRRKLGKEPMAQINPLHAKLTMVGMTDRCSTEVSGAAR